MYRVRASEFNKEVVPDLVDLGLMVLRMLERAFADHVVADVLIG